MVEVSKGTLTWAAENEVRWLAIGCGDQSHRVRLGAKDGLFFEQHGANPELLIVEASLLHPAEWSGCFILSLWFCGKLSWVRASAVPNPDGPSVMGQCLFARTNETISVPEPGVPASYKVAMEGEPLAISLWRRIVYAVEGKQVEFNWVPRRGKQTF